jgi:transposase
MFKGSVPDIVGIYLDPPERAVVLCVDELSQIQPLDRTQPGLPLKKGRAETSCWKHAFGMMTHDYKRHSTTTLFAAPDVKSGMVIGDCMRRHRARKFLRFLRRIDRTVVKPRDVHRVVNSEADQKTVRRTVFLLNAAQKTPEVKARLASHPRFKLHFTPTCASWVNLVERFFAEIASKRIRRGSYTSVGDLEPAIYHYLGQHNTKPKPFPSTKTAEDILARERRALNKLEEIRRHPPPCQSQ